MFALVESAFRVVDLGNMANILERRRSLPDHHDGLPDRLKKEIRESFPILDTDCDGLVSRDQVEYLVYRIDPGTTPEEMQDLLDTADLDSDGMYDMDEYLFLMYLKWNDQESVDDIKEAFRVFDKDNSGALSREEFGFILKRLGEPLNDLEVDEILTHFDRDGSGEIDFDEFAYVMTGPHLDEGGDDTGIPFANRSSMATLRPDSRHMSTSVNRSASRKLKSKPKAKSADHSKKKDESTTLAGVHGRRIVNSAPAGRETIKFSKSGGPETAKGAASKKNITSGAELRVLGSSRPLTSGKVIAYEKPAPSKPKAPPASDSVIERYHDFYGQTATDIKKKSERKVSDPSIDSDNFSMCSEVLRHMNTTDHYIPGSDEEDYV